MKAAINRSRCFERIERLVEARKVWYAPLINVPGLEEGVVKSYLELGTAFENCLIEEVRYLASQR